jgi:hypothetical protein
MMSFGEFLGGTGGRCELVASTDLKIVFSTPGKN